MNRFLSHKEARAFYDRFGAKQDRQGYYENSGRDALFRHADFENARSVFEFGCGTGRFAENLFLSCFSGKCLYVGMDTGSTMVHLPTERLKPWKPRGTVLLSDGGTDLVVYESQFDRFVST